MGCRLRVMALFILVLSIFFFFLSSFQHVYIENLCKRFLRHIGTTILKLCIHMDNELWYSMIENKAHCSYASLYLIHLSIFMSFLDKFVSHSPMN